jgi:glycosyltransferase involved in cell wall biosynthesis
LSIRVAVNARYLRQPLAGVQRYAREVVRRLGDRVRLVAPAGVAGGPAGHIWEQTLLPGLVEKGEMLWSPANTGPLRLDRHVVTIHDLSALDHPEWYASTFAAWYGYLLPRLARRVRRVLTVSEFSRRRIIERLGVEGDHVVVAPCGVDSERFRPREANQATRLRERLGLPAEYLLAVGSVEPRKNLGRLIEAWKSLPRTSRPMLVIAGRRAAPFRRPVVALRAEGVRWLNGLADDDLPVLYGGALACVNVSLYEGFGLTVLEAMACGIPVVASGAEALRELAGEAALIVDPLDVGAIAEGLRRIVQDGALRAALRVRGLNLARRFTWEATAEGVWAALQAGGQAG